jgi:hypothetical protein
MYPSFKSSLHMRSLVLSFFYSLELTFALCLASEALKWSVSYFLKNSALEVDFIGTFIGLYRRSLSLFISIFKYSLLSYIYLLSISKQYHLACHYINRSYTHLIITYYTHMHLIHFCNVLGVSIMYFNK